MSDWTDPDDAPELTAAMAEVAEIAIGGKVIRPATGYLGRSGVVKGRPPLRGAAKRQVTLRLDPDVIEKFREGGPGWQVRMTRRCGRRRISAKSGLTHEACHKTV